MKIRHDVHTHSHLSSCSADREAIPKNFIRTAAELGHTVFGFSNHLWDEAVDGESPFYRKQGFTHILTEKEEIRSIDNCGMKVLFGAEVEYCGKTDTLSLKSENAHLLDYVLIPHTHTHMEGFVIPEVDKVTEFKALLTEKFMAAFPWISEKKAQGLAKSFKTADVMAAIDYSWAEHDAFVAEFMMKSYEQLLENHEFIKISKTIPTIIAHPFFPCGTAERIAQEYELIDKDRMRESFIKTAQMGVAFDVNVNTYRFELHRDPLVKIMKLAKECGVKFAFGTDAHSVATLASVSKGDAISEAIGIEESDIYELVK